jgi:hypothetical protein
MVNTVTHCKPKFRRKNRTPLPSSRADTQPAGLRVKICFIAALSLRKGVKKVENYRVYSDHKRDYKQREKPYKDATHNNVI